MLCLQEEIDTFMTQPENENCEKVLQRLDEQHGKYRFMAYNLEARRRKLKSQIPDLERSLEMVNVLGKENEERETQFLLSDQVFIKTLVPPTKTVYLWLGASVMLEYPLDEAESLLKQNITSAIANLKSVEHDQDFLRSVIWFYQYVIYTKCPTYFLQRSNYHYWGKHGQSL